MHHSIDLSTWWLCSLFHWSYFARIMCCSLHYFVIKRFYIQGWYLLFSFLFFLWENRIWRGMFFGCVVLGRLGIILVKFQDMFQCIGSHVNWVVGASSCCTSSIIVKSRKEIICLSLSLDLWHFLVWKHTFVGIRCFQSEFLSPFLMTFPIRKYSFHWLQFS